MSKRSEEENFNAVVTDYELERGEHPIGKLVHLSTVTHAWRGVLEAVTPSGGGGGGEGGGEGSLARRGGLRVRQGRHSVGRALIGRQLEPQRRDRGLAVVVESRVRHGLPDKVDDGRPDRVEHGDDHGNERVHRV